MFSQFDQVEYCNVDSDNLDRYVLFYPVLEGNTFSHLSLEDFKETGDETFAWESFEKKLSAYSFLKYLVQENDIHVDLSGLKTFLSFSETDTEK